MVAAGIEVIKSHKIIKLTPAIIRDNLTAPTSKELEIVKWLFCVNKYQYLVNLKTFI